ncbi:hypothetical protein EfmAA818_29970 (plasmid) [Enterococcus faecium]|nr:hypothetical protein EfmAA818_29970 [Enterococcus faecium]
MKLSGGQQQRVAIARDVAYSYANSKEKVLSGVNQKFELGKFYAIVGKSGTGKSTLLSLLAGLDKVADSADIILELSGKKLKKVNKMNLEVE